MAVILLAHHKERYFRYRDTLLELGAAVTDDPGDADALLLPGGGDVDPALYGQTPAGAADVDGGRDAEELRLLRAFCAAGRPVLGICRGLQLINVAFGGTLHQHIEGHSRVDGRDRLHAVRTDDPLLRALYGGRFVVNSAHHQSIDALADGFDAVQWAEDGTIEAIRHRVLPVFAVQWHPERLRGAADGRDLLRAFLRSIDSRKT